MRFKISPIVLIFLLDVFLIITISCIIGYAFYLLNISFTSAFLLSFVLISLLGYFSNKLIENKTSVILNKINLEREKIESNQIINLNCSYCKSQNNVKLNLNSNMLFECLNCKQSNRILFSVGTARVTTPLNVSMPIQNPIPDRDD